MRIYRKSEGINVLLRSASEEDLMELERDFPYDVTLPTLSHAGGWILEIADRKIGFIEYMTREEEVLVTGLWVRPDKRGNGYGTMMLELVEATETPKFMRVIVTPSSAGFYEKRGYSEDQGFTVLTKVIGYDSY
jgi:GNAT superfamily N-acetyltransferase